MPNRVKRIIMLVVTAICVMVCHGAKFTIRDDSAIGIREGSPTAGPTEVATHEILRKKVPSKKARTRDRENGTVTALADHSKAEGRFFLKVSDIAMHVLQQNMESIPPPLRGPLMFFMGFSQQSMENIMSNMRSFGQMIITSLVMMAVKRIYFSDLPTEADRNKASQLTDSIMDMVNVFI